MRDRLIELIKNCAKQPIMIEGLELWADNIADYLLENGVIVPPCKVGDKMYFDGKHFASHCAGEIMERRVDVVLTEVWATFRGDVDVSFDFENFGKKVFLSREQAEKALSEASNAQH